MISLLNASLTGLWIALGVILAIVVVVALWVISTYNGFVKLKVNAEEGYSTMDVYLKKRYDLIPNLVETVKGYAKHEKETLQSVIAARNSAMSATSVQEKAQAETELNKTLKTIFALSESYPDLKANQNFVSLQQQLQQMEQDIANARKYYNATVKMLNVKVQSFPSNVVANMFKFTKRDMFEVTDANEGENVKVEF
jgi:LemA protein